MKELTFITALKDVFDKLTIQELKALTTQDRIYFCDLLEESGYKIINRAQACADR
jgi:hypothetical protein